MIHIIENTKLIILKGILLIVLSFLFINGNPVYLQKMRRITNDDMWSRLWYLNNTVKPNMNIMEAWSLGANGKGVVIAIVDDGLQVDHPELKDNFDARASHDFLDGDKNPYPNTNTSHGTRLAGIIAAKGNDMQCGIGIADGAKVGGIRMLKPDGITPLTEARALIFGRNHIDIYSVSWGPGDDGIKVGKPTYLAKWALEVGTQMGRGGNGNIYVWAAGNGGSNGDHCGADGYVNSPYTIAVAGVAATGRIPWYSEKCAAILTTAVTSRTHSLYSTDFDLFTTELRSRCVGTQGATSTAAPMVAAVVAMGLQVNPKLSWRDVQHLLIVSSKPDGVFAPDWSRNGVGRMYSHWFGYGVVDAALFVRNSRRHTRLPEQKKCTSKVFIKNFPLVGIRHLSTFIIKSNGCNGRVRHLENVILRMTVAYRQRGLMSIGIRSPMGSESILLEPRRRDVFYLSFRDWNFLSTHFWGENPNGNWVVFVRLFGPRYNRGRIYSAKLILYGTS